MITFIFNFLDESIDSLHEFNENLTNPLGKFGLTYSIKVDSHLQIGWSFSLFWEKMLTSLEELNIP